MDETKFEFTDNWLKKAMSAPEGQRLDFRDTEVPGFGLRVTDKGKKTFVLVARYPGGSGPTRRAIGEYGSIKLKDARQRARDWKELIRQGKDPKDLEAERRLEEQRKRDNSFGAVVEEYIKLAVVGPDEEKPFQRKGLEVARELRQEFVNDNGKRKGLDKRPIDSITPHDIVRVVDDAVKRGAKYQAHNLLGHVRVFFNWAISRGVYGIDHSPCDRMKPKQVIGPKALRTRVLTDLEMAAFWKATGRMGYPFGDLFRLLLVTGQRKSEVAEAVWSEFDLKKNTWTIPPARMKSEAPHIVPLSDAAVTILETLPRFKGPRTSDHLFSTTSGVKPVSGFSKTKARLDKHMLWILKAMARKRGDSASRISLPDFVLHDLRRTMRTGLSGLPVSSLVAELVIAHTQKGLHKVYDQHAYLDEKRQALDLWAGKLRDIVTPAPDNVVPLKARDA